MLKVECVEDPDLPLPKFIYQYVYAGEIIFNSLSLGDSASASTQFVAVRLLPRNDLSLG
jgi:hypothetical protein